jgi:hypothetical protein
MNPIQYSLTNESLTLIIDGKPHAFQKSAPNFKALRQAVLDERWDDIPNHLTVAKSLNEWAKGRFTLQGNRFKFDGMELPPNLNQRIIDMASKGDDPTRFFKFWERLQKNPSYRSVQQLFGFLNNGGIPLTKDGCFLAYKSVDSQLKDHHSHTFDNTPGQTLEMPRNQISDDPTLACHEGFHVGALGYVRNTYSSGRTVICKVDPEHVVCVPHDASQQKMRVCKYKVVGFHNGEKLSDTAFDEYLELDPPAPNDPSGTGLQPPPDFAIPAVQATDAEVAEYKTPITDTILKDGEKKPEVVFAVPDDSNDPELEKDDEDANYDVNKDMLASTCEECEKKIPFDMYAAEEKNYYHSPVCSMYDKSNPPPKKTAPAAATILGVGGDQVGPAPKPAPDHKVPPAKTDAPKTAKKSALDKMSTKELMEVDLGTLRSYAAHELKIVGASKIPGGKVALVGRIKKVRDSEND